MTLQFHLDNVRTTEFGVGKDEMDEQTFRCIAVDGDVQTALREMVNTTWDFMTSLTDSPPRYDPSEKHASREYVQLPLVDDLAAWMRDLHQAENLDLDSGALSDPTAIFCYFARLTDGQGRRLTAIRRATQFKGILKSRLIQFMTDALRIVEDNVFKLDNDFDMLIDTNSVHILRPSGFEFVGKLQQAILDAVPSNCQAIAADLTFVEFAGIEEYAKSRPRAARYLASIKSLGEMSNIDTAALKNLCTRTSVDFSEVNGKLVVQDGHVMGFLEVLDRRRYEIELVRDSPEQFRAPSRQRIGN